MNDINSFIVDNYMNTTYNELANVVNKKFNSKLTAKQIKDRIYCLRRRQGMNLPLKTNNKVNSTTTSYSPSPFSPLDLKMQKEKSSISVSKNQTDITLNVDEKPNGVDEILKKFHVDTDVWKVDRHYISERTDIQEKKTYYACKVTLVRAKPEIENLPPISSINVKSPIVDVKKNNNNKKSNLKKALIIPDSQNGYLRDFYSSYLDPFHDRRAWDLAIQIAEVMQPDRIIFLGDMLDLPDWSDKFLRTPEMYWTTQPALQELNWWFQKLRKIVPKAQMDYLEGNHESRLYKQIVKYSAALYNLQRIDQIQFQPSYSIPNLLALDKLNITYHSNYPNNEIWLNDNLVVNHGSTVRQGSGMTAANLIKEARSSIIFGHIHRIETATKTVFNKEGEISYKVVTPGCICRIDGIVPGYKSKNNWQQGLAEVIYQEGNGLFEINVINITKGRCIYNEQIFQSKFDIKELVTDTGNQNFIRK